ncbi:tetratricopeptide repeat protein 36-like [Acanthaster planci]|uniref:Tetratricopeptide repeat protein 36-like n=1 Tax=Acanthaster planci TaxID=133434 RepID=A0A8B7YFF5_ACAPL|nr:tetratricopeptide repeat protein 36-like [Acanthaster planci]
MLLNPLSYDNSEDAQQAKELELQGVHSAEAGDIDSAISFFNKAVQVAPERASCYNNRAQALRLKGDVIGAFEDLNHAIELSGGRGKAACQAYTQRALINRLEGHDDEALSDFKMAACLGSAFARSQVVRMNPYAAMCNQMLSDVIGRLKAGEYQD